ncbi:MAG: hypothetical protein V7746_01545 [Halioglobus sp.]
MHELRRRAYLDTMGVATYVSRHPLPGAMASRKWVVNRAVTNNPQAQVVQAEPTAVIPQLDVVAKPRTIASAPVREQTQANKITQQSRAFSFAALQTGTWLWLEELPVQQALMRDQVLLVQAIARALGWGDARPEVAPLFNWPMHNNQQLDLGDEAAKSALGGFIRRRLEEAAGCQGLIILGREAQQCVPIEQLNVENTVCIASTAEMLRQPELKKSAWQALRPFAD